MTTEQEHLITLLFIKRGGWQAVVDAWLFSDANLTAEEDAAIDAWMNSEQSKPHNLQVVKDAQYPYITAEITLDLPDKD